MNRYLLKVNGELRCPSGICRPDHASQWEGRDILLPLSGPVLARSGKQHPAPAIQPGDELWVWTHEDDDFGRGWGLTAKATAGPSKVVGDQLAVQLVNVDRLPRPFGFRDLFADKTRKTTGSRLLDYTRSYTLLGCYLIEDDDYDAFCQVVDERSSALPDDIRFAYATGWEREILTHKQSLLDGLQNRRLATQKPRDGQQAFRAELIRRYKGQCVLTRCAVPEALEAAHIMPHTGDALWDSPDNGLLLRRDLHSLFDAMLWSINPKDSTVQVAERLKPTLYGKLHGRTVMHHAAPELLNVHFLQFRALATNQVSPRQKVDVP
jgi:hypothetical protein